MMVALLHRAGVGMLAPMRTGSSIRYKAQAKMETSQKIAKGGETRSGMNTHTHINMQS